ncbi:hypothetical protein B0H16DRAFT_1849836 [Mycena metata]|uniref:Uncharacterized protein n=1 Tax=Mycena metata TaxID=1033252 RepID=A0AAD7DJQ0_9AGAR|nr:hypothetical protein B0H16DRAFT_1849836 [Mycena metata]
MKKWYIMRAHPPLVVPTSITLGTGNASDACISIGCVPLDYIPNENVLDDAQTAVYLSAFNFLWLSVLGHFVAPMSFRWPNLLNLSCPRFTRSHVSHMRVDRLRRHPTYVNAKSNSLFLAHFFLLFSSWMAQSSLACHFSHPNASVNVMNNWADDGDTDFESFHYDYFDTTKQMRGNEDCVNLSSLGLSMRLRGGQGSDSEDSDDSNASASPRPSKKRKVAARKRTATAKAKGKSKASPVADSGLRVTLAGANGAPGMFVDEVIDLDTAPECWDVPQFHRIAYILDVSATPDCLRGKGAKTRTVDAHVKKQCQDAWVGGTGSKKSGLAKVTILDEGEDYLSDFERWDSPGSAAQDVSAANRAAKVAEATDVVVIATAFYRSTSTVTKVPREVRKSILLQLFRGEQIVEDDTEIVEGPCPQIIHPSHLPRNKECPCIHFRDNKHVVGKLTAQCCPAELLILIPIDETDLRAVIIPKSGIPHTHPNFPRSKVPYTAAKQYRSAIDAVGLIGTTTLRVDKVRLTRSLAASTKAMLGGLLPEEVHPSLISKRKRRDMVKDARSENFPEGMGLKGTVIGRVWTDRATREAFVLVWNGIFEAIESITGKAPNFNVFSKTSSLLGVIGDAEGAQAQGLGDVIILRGMNTATVNGVATVTVDTILLFIWKTCLVHFKRGVFALESHVTEFVFNCLLGFPYLETTEEIAEYRAFCETSTNPKVKNWWAHKISYPWLLPSLNRSLTSMSHLHWDLTPGDTNPIEGSHVQDNQVNATNRTLIEAILLAREYDNNTARVIKASLTSGVLENGNNSLQARYAAAARRQTRNKAKAVERAAADGGKKVRAKLKAAEQESRAKDLEIARLTAMLAAGPSTPRRIASPFPQTNHTPPANLSPVAGPSRLPALNLFPSLPPMTPIAEPRSDFDYQLAMRSDILDATLHRINQLPMYRGKLDSRNRLMYSVGSDDEVLASDPYPISP